MSLEHVLNLFYNSKHPDVVDSKAKKKIERGSKKISNREQSRLDGNGLFKPYSIVNYNNLCHNLKKKDNVFDNAAATINNTKTAVNFDPNIKRHLQLKKVVSEQTTSCTIPISSFNKLPELLAL